MVSVLLPTILFHSYGLEFPEKHKCRLSTVHNLQKIELKCIGRVLITSHNNLHMRVDDVNDLSFFLKNCFAGNLCEIEIDYCASNPCGNGASCLSTQGSNDTTNDRPYICLCPDGFTGDLCHVSNPITRK